MASAGVATLTVTGNQPGAITITASATGSAGALTPGTGNPITFNVVTGTASKIALSGSTANLTAGTTRTLTATIQDSAGNTITTGADSTLSVTFAKTTGTGSVTGVGSVNAVAGVANITITGATAGSVTIGASGGSLAAGTGNPITFTVVANTTVDHFAFATISSPQTAGTPFNITITAQDAGNNTVIGYSGNGFKVKLTSTGTFSASTAITTAAFTNGVLTNHSVTITNTGNFTITATDNGGGTATGTSNSFQVNAGAASKLAFIQQPTNTNAGQAAITPAVTVQIQDANGNLTNSTASVAIAIANNPSSGTLSGTTPVTAVNGTATFADLSINKGGTGYTLQATSAGLTSVTSAPFNINNPAPNLTSIAPTSGNISDTLDVVFNGTNYISGVTNVSFGTNITVNTVTVNSSIKLTANITIGSGAAVGQRNVSVTNPVPGGGTATLTNGFTVNNPATTTVVTSSSVGNTSTYGQSVTVTATVTTGSGTPTGSVTFYDSATCGGTALAGPTNLDANGKASFTTTSLTAPGHTITGCYTPTGIYRASNGSITQTVNKAHLTVTADDKSKPYDGHIFTAFTSTITGFVNGDTSSVVITGSAAYTGDATGALNAGTYTITPTVGSLSAANYDFTVFKNGTLTIDKIDATWTTNNASKTYGNADPNPLTTGSGSGFAASDNVTATYTRAAGESVAGGSYHITAALSPASVLTNYNITNLGADFTIKKRDATWTTNDASKTYGTPDPTPLTTGSGSGFLFSDSVTATYGRAPGETAAGSPYHITAMLAPAAALANYNITNDGANFTIDRKDASVTPNAASKTYGSADPVFTGTLVGFVAADNVTATYTRAAGETVAGSPYKISATLAPAGVLGNYNITYNTADFTIEKKDASVTPNAANKIYGSADPAFTGTLVGFLAGDNVTASYSRTSGETVAGSPYKISATLSPAGVLGNYNITYNTADFTIEKKDASVTPNAANKIYGSADPAFTGTLVGFLTADNVTATYSRTAGETVASSPYKISATLSPAGVLGNYNITYDNADFTIEKKDASVTPNAASKIYGEVDPAFTGTLVQHHLQHR
ncbi:MAG: hypothetical protein DMF15_07325 [Verrucomicrobia bacterium]|nr:MAG: hypothetical protein DMF15_07325 [Verrucomicrobiota bacterium]